MTFQYKGKQHIAGANAVVALAPPAGADIAHITVEGAGVRYWLDGSAPTSSVGHLLQDLEQIRFESVDLSAIKLYVPNTVNVFVSYLNSDQA